jgi:hypothetical protein
MVRFEVKFDRLIRKILTQFIADNQPIVFANGHETSIKTTIVQCT